MYCLSEVWFSGDPVTAHDAKPNELSEQGSDIPSSLPPSSHGQVCNVPSPTYIPSS